MESSTSEVASFEATYKKANRVHVHQASPTTTCKPAKPLYARTSQASGQKKVIAATKPVDTSDMDKSTA
jgi:hypothetical protein